MQYLCIENKVFTIIVVKHKMYTTTDFSHRKAKIDNFWTIINNPKTFKAWKEFESLMKIKEKYPVECSKYTTFISLMENLPIEDSYNIWE